MRSLSATRVVVAIFVLTTAPGIGAISIRQAPEHRTPPETPTNTSGFEAGPQGQQTNPFKVSVSLPSPVRLGEIIPVNITVYSSDNSSLHVTSEILDSTEYEIVSVGPRRDTEELQEPPGRRSGCLSSSQPNSSHVFRLRTRATGLVNVTVGVSAKHQQTCSHTEFTDSDYIYVESVNMTVAAEGIRREQVQSQYRCGLDVRDGLTSMESWRVEAPSVAVNGSVKARLTSATTFTAHMLQNVDSMVGLDRGDLQGVKVATLNNLLSTAMYGDGVPKGVYAIIEKGLNEEKGWRERLRQKNGSYSVRGSSHDTPNSWMTAYMLMTGSINDDWRIVRQSIDWLHDLQNVGKDEDGCFSLTGPVYHDLLKRGGRVAPALLTAYTVVGISVANHDGPPPFHPFLARDCMVNDNSTDPFDLAVMAYAMATLQVPEGEDMLKELFKQATETDAHIFWDLPDEGAASSKGVQVASYAALAIMRRYHRHNNNTDKLHKIVKWIAETANSAGGFQSVFDTMAGVRAQLYYDQQIRSLKYDLSVVVEGDGVNQTLTHTNHNEYEQQDVVLPILPTNLTFQVQGSGCTLLQAVVQYNVLEDLQSDVFTLSVNNVTTAAINLLNSNDTDTNNTADTRTVTNNSNTTAVGESSNNANTTEVSNTTTTSDNRNNNSTTTAPERTANATDTTTERTANTTATPTERPSGSCLQDRVRVCISYQQPNTTSNLVAIEVGLVSGYAPVRPDLNALVTQEIIAQFEEYPGKVVLFIEGLEREERCVDFGVSRETVVEDTKPAKVFVYDYFQPEVARSMSYSLPSVTCSAASS